MTETFQIGLFDDEGAAPAVPSSVTTIEAAALPHNEDTQFYPTPRPLIEKMVAKYKETQPKNYAMYNLTKILEPSAGKGDIADYLSEYKDYTGYGGRLDLKPNIDVVEIDPNLSAILRGKGYRLVGDDFLSFNPLTRYDLIIMNPPFADGARHLLHAIQLQEHGGAIVCLLNAETIRNPYTNDRKLLVQKLNEYEADIEYIEDAFKHAEVKTDVEVALVTINIKPQKKSSFIFDHFKEAEQHEEQEIEHEQMIPDDGFDGLIAQYNAECRYGIALIEEYAAIAPYIANGSSAMLRLTVGKEDCNDNGIVSIKDINRYLKVVRGKYWHKLGEMPQLTSKMTSDMQKEYYSKISEMENYEFNKFNILQLLCDLQVQLKGGVEDSIMGLFDTLSGKYAWFHDNENNIHYYNGWATNKAHKVGMKAILPTNGFSSWGYRGSVEYTFRDYQVRETIVDLERALNFLDKGETTFHSNLDMAFQNKKMTTAGQIIIELTWFTATFYKKGTCHIKFKDNAKNIIDRLNIYAGKNRGWLPPDYGKTRYKDMSKEAQEVIDSFQGKAEYDKVMRNPQKYILDTGSMNLLTEGNE